jgi:hypothetical protein
MIIDYEGYIKWVMVANQDILSYSIRHIHCYSEVAESPRRKRILCPGRPLPCAGQSMLWGWTSDRSRNRDPSSSMALSGLVLTIRHGVLGNCGEATSHGTLPSTRLGV